MMMGAPAGRPHSLFGVAVLWPPGPTGGSNIGVRDPAVTCGQSRDVRLLPADCELLASRLGCRA